MLLHKSSSPQLSGILPRAQSPDFEDLKPFRSSVRKVLSDCLKKLQEEPAKQRSSIRWELGACWVQHLQNVASGKTETKKNEETAVEPTVKGLGKQLGPLKAIKKKADGKGTQNDTGKENSNCNDLDSERLHVDASEQKELNKTNSEKEIVLQKLLPQASFLRLKESDTGLHVKV